MADQMTAKERAKKMDDECNAIFNETRVSEFYTLRDKWRELYARHIREAEEAAEQRGVEFAATALAEQVKYYPEDIFTPPPATADLTGEQRTLVSQAGGAMARFICGRWPDVIRERFAERGRDEPGA